MKDRLGSRTGHRQSFVVYGEIISSTNVSAAISNHTSTRSSDPHRTVISQDDRTFTGRIFGPHLQSSIDDRTALRSKESKPRLPNRGPHFWIPLTTWPPPESDGSFPGLIGSGWSGWSREWGPHEKNFVHFAPVEWSPRTCLGTTGTRRCRNGRSDRSSILRVKNMNIIL